MIILFIITGAVFLMSTNDLVSIFLSIELQSYGLYLLSTIYRNSELSTTGGLIYFLLGATGSGNSLPLRRKLPNSGDTLRLMTLSNTWKGICGWTNYSCIVTTYKMDETRIGYRGSKSGDVMALSVKEQRVYGNLLGTLSSIKCILKSFERNYRVGIPPKQIRFGTSPLQYFSTCVAPLENNNLPRILDPWWAFLYRGRSSRWGRLFFHRYFEK